MSQQQSPIATEILGFEKARTQALIARDMPALEALVAMDFVYTHGSARVDNRETYLERMGSDAFVFLAASYEDIAVQDHGDVAVLTGKLFFDVIPKDQAPITQRFQFIGVWKREGRGWRLTAFQNTRLGG